MPRRHVITDVQFDRLLALPTGEADLIRHYTLSPDDLAVIARRRRPHNRLGFALQLCALRYPGRLVRPGETVPMEVAWFLGEQLDIDPAAISDYAIRAQTRYEQLDTLCEVFGFRGFTQPDHRALSQWLLPIAMTTASAVSVAEALMVELRRRGIAAPGVTVIDRMVATAMLGAERKVAEQLIRGLSESQRAALDTLLEIRDETAISTLAWARQSPGAPGFRSLARLIDQLDHLRQIGLDPGVRAAVHHDRIKQLAQEGARLTAQHLRALSPARRRAILLVTVLDSTERLTDDAIGVFDRLIGRLFRRAERRASADLQRDARTINEKVRLLIKVGEVLISAKESGEEPFGAVARVIPWAQFVDTIKEAKGLIRPDGPDYLALAERNHALMRRIGPLFLGAFTFHGVAAVSGLVRAIEMLRPFYTGNRRTLPKDLPTGFICRGWRQAVMPGGKIDGAAYELCFFAELRDRLRAGDIWIAGSRQYLRRRRSAHRKAAVRRHEGSRSASCLRADRMRYPSATAAGTTQ
jgi:hypothetical protein